MNMAKMGGTDDGNGHEISMLIEQSKTQDTSYDDAVGQAGNGLFHKMLLIACGGCLMGVINESLNIGFIMPAAECDLHLSLSDKGILNGMAFLGIVVSSHFWGFLSDTWGRRKVLLLASLSAFIVSVISSFSTTIAMFAVTRFLVGFLISGNAATTYTYISEFQTIQNRPRAVAFAAMFMGFSFIYLPALAWVIISGDSLAINIPSSGIHIASWRVYIICCSTLNGLVALALKYLPESPKFLLVKGRTEEAMQVLNTVYRCNFRNTDTEYPIKKIDLNSIDNSVQNQQSRSSPNSTSSSTLLLLWNQTVPLFKMPLVWNTFRTGFLMFSLFATSSGLFMWVPDILKLMISYKNNNENNETTICEVVTENFKLEIGNSTEFSKANCPVIVDPLVYQIALIMGVIFAVFYAINGFVINIFGKKKLTIFWFILSGACGILLITTKWFYLNLLLLVLFLTSGVIGGLVSAISVELFPTHLRAMALCLILMIGRLGAMLASNMIGSLILNHCSWIFIILSGGMFMSSILGVSIKGV